MDGPGDVIKSMIQEPALVSLLAMALLPALLPAADQPGGKYLVYVGTYTDKESASKGIYVFRYDSLARQFGSPSLAAKTQNPSFLAVSPAGRFVYAVNEISDYEDQHSGGVTTFRVDRKSGRLTFLNEVASRGADPCYISLDKTGHYVLVANYTGGSLATFSCARQWPLGPSSCLPPADWIERESGTTGGGTCPLD